MIWKKAHLRVVQLVLSDDLDCDLAAGLAVDGLVDIGESTISHLFNKSETFQSLNVSMTYRSKDTNIPRKLASFRFALARPLQSSRPPLGSLAMPLELLPGSKIAAPEPERLVAIAYRSESSTERVAAVAEELEFVVAEIAETEKD